MFREQRHAEIYLTDIIGYSSFNGFMKIYLTETIGYSNLNGLFSPL